MNHLIYSYSLCIALPLMLFFGFYFLFGRTPDKAIFANYLRSRRTMGAAVLLLAVNYSIHFFFEIRFRNVNSAILLNLSTYFLCYWLFSSALTSLLDRFYITRRRLVIHLCLWVMFSIFSSIVLFVLSEGLMQKIGMLAMALWLVIYGVILALRLVFCYRRAVKLFDDTHSDDIGTYIRWLSIFTYWALIFGIGCGLLTFLPNEYIYIWILSSVPFYVYLFCSYLNYLLFYEKVESAFETEITDENEIMGNPEPDMVIGSDGHEQPAYHSEIAAKVNEWIDAAGYLSPGLTIKELSETLNTNRTYLSAYIKNTYNTTFRDWIAYLRIEFAKRQMEQHPEQNISEIYEMSGFLSQSHFMKTFKEHEGYSPAQWRKMKGEESENRGV